METEQYIITRVRYDSISMFNVTSTFKNNCIVDGRVYIPTTMDLDILFMHKPTAHKNKLIIEIETADERIIKFKLMANPFLKTTFDMNDYFPPANQKMPPSCVHAHGEPAMPDLSPSNLSKVEEIMKNDDARVEYNNFLHYLEKQKSMLKNTQDVNKVAMIHYLYALHVVKDPKGFNGKNIRAAIVNSLCME